MRAVPLPNKGSRFGAMLLTAILLHAMLLWVVVPTSRPAEQTRLGLQWMELAPPEPLLQPEPEPAPEPEPVRPHEPRPRASTPTPISPPEPAAKAPADSELPPVSAQRLREQTLIASRAQIDQAQPESAPLEPRAVPRLPGTTGWMNDYVGTVNAKVEFRREADGSQSARVVMPSGQVLCGQARAPTMAESFNPWMSTQLMMWQTCGRERPRASESDDPWQRSRGRPGD